MYLGVVVVVILRDIAAALEVVDLGGRHAKDEDIILAHGVVYLDVCTVHRAEGYCAVEHELHVARAACLGARKGYLLADIGGGHESLRHGDVIILHVNDLHQILYVGVIVNEL